jgi:hypothetical protein
VHGRVQNLAPEYYALNMILGVYRAKLRTFLSVYDPHLLNSEDVLGGSSELGSGMPWSGTDSESFNLNAA